MPGSRAQFLLGRFNRRDPGKKIMKILLLGHDLARFVLGKKDHPIFGKSLDFKKMAGRLVFQNFSFLRTGHLPLLSTWAP